MRVSRTGTGLLARSVHDAMVTAPKVCPPDTTVAGARACFADDHVHSVLVVHGRQLVSVVERADVVGADDHLPVARLGRLTGRTVGPTVDLETARARMLDLGLRRLAVVDRTHTLLGLLCLKRSGAGFCSDDDISRRAAGLPH